MAARIDHGVASGTFSLDGETLEVDNNIWVVGDDEECVVIDAPHDVDAILEASIRAALFSLPDETIVHTGHGEDTTIGTERAGMAAQAEETS